MPLYAGALDQVIQQIQDAQKSFPVVLDFSTCFGIYIYIYIYIIYIYIYIYNNQQEVCLTSFLHYLWEWEGSQWTFAQEAALSTTHHVPCFVIKNFEDMVDG